MHHSLTRHRNFSVLSNYLGITANESRSPFASAECRRLFLLHRVYFVYTRTYKDIHVRRTHTNAKRVDFKIAAAAAAPRRPHKLPARAFSIPAGYPKDRVPTAPKHAGDEGKAGGGRERTIGEPFLVQPFPTLGEPVLLPVDARLTFPFAVIVAGFL